MEQTLLGRVVDVTRRSGTEATHFVVARDTGVTRRGVTFRRITATLDTAPGALVAWTTRRRTGLSAGDVVEVTIDLTTTPPLVTGLAAPGAPRWRTLDLRATGEWLIPPDPAALGGSAGDTAAVAGASGVAPATGAADGVTTHAGRAGRVLAVGLVTAALLLVTGLIVWARPETPTNAAQAGPPERGAPTPSFSSSPPTQPASTTSTTPVSGTRHGPAHGLGTPPATAPPPQTSPATLPSETMPVSSPLPDVSRLSVTDATRILSRAGLTVVVADGVTGDRTVARTNPPAGALVEPGDTIRLVVVAENTAPSSPPTPSTDPTVTLAPSTASAPPP